MVGIEEELPIITQAGEATGQKAEDQFFGVAFGRLAHFRERGRLDANLVVGNVIAADFNRAFKFAVLNREPMGMPRDLTWRGPTHSRMDGKLPNQP